MHLDENPVLGTKHRVPRHVSRFFAWAEKHDVLTIGQCLEAITYSQHETLLLSGALAFLSHSETGDVLNSWAESTNNGFVHSLARLSRALAVTFPELKTPSTSGTISAELDGHLTTGYLGAMLAARTPADLNDSQRDGLTCLRLWVLVKALEYAVDGHPIDGNLQVASGSIRRAIDDSHAASRIWLSGLSKANPSFPAFGDHLVAACNQKGTSAPTGISDPRTALKNLAQGRKKKPDGDFATTLQGSTGLSAQVWDQASKPPTQGFSTALITREQDGHEVFVLPDDAFISIPANPKDTPDRQSVKARRFVFQTIEERQYLPCSWHHIRADEQKLLLETLKLQMTSELAESALTAAFTVLAMFTRNTLDTVGGLLLGSDLQEDWTLDLDLGHLKRQPSRPHVRWRHDEDSESWIKPLANQWCFELDSSLLKVLRQARQAQPAAKKLGDLWASTQSPYSAFRAMCRQTDGLARISSQAIGLLGERLSYLDSHDSTYARLVMAPPSAGIAGSGSYASFPVSRPLGTLEKIASGYFVPKPSVSELGTDPNGLGSELDPDDRALSRALFQAADKLEEPPSAGDWIQRHNRLTAYAVAALFACTGGRPSNSPFESIKHFDLIRMRAYIEDKATAQMADGTHGRIVPLPTLAGELISSVYLPYLKQLGDQLKQRAPKLSHELLAHAKGIGSDRLPLFFFLRQIPTFAWIEVSESSLTELGGFDWPLPWNLFRHRLAIRLREVGLDPELIDAQLGHAEVGTETYGDNSTRCWEEDEPEWRKALENALLPLSIRIPKVAVAQVPAGTSEKDDIQFRETSRFGSESRRVGREKSRALARDKALQDIKAQIGTHDPKTLGSEKWDAIGRSMLLQEGNQPHSNASIRYEVFESYVRRLWHEQGYRVPLRRRFIKITPPRTGHSSGALHATELLRPVRESLDQAFKRPLSLLSVRNASYLAALDMALTSKVADRAVLAAVVTADSTRIRLVIESQTAYLDFHERQHQFDQQPARRFLVPARSAPLINKALKSKTKVYEREQEADYIQAIISALPAHTGVTSRESLLSHVAQLVDFENSLALPGLFSAVLAGRTKTYALSHTNWIRAKHGQLRRPNDLVTPETPPSEASGQTPEPSPPETSVELSSTQSTSGNDFRSFRGLVDVPVGHQWVKTDERVEAEKSDKKLLERVRRLLRHLAGQNVDLSEFSDLPATTRLKNATTDSVSRDAVKATIRDLLNNAHTHSSPSIRILGAWTIHLLDRKNRRGRGKLAPRSILRYLSALSSGFLSYGRNVDLRFLNDSQLTDFYLNVIDGSMGETLHGASDERDAAAEDDGFDDEELDENESTPVTLEKSDAATNSRSGSKIAETYVLERLVEFHRFASDWLDLVDPDWSEIGDGLSASTVSTGFITPDEYLKSLELICPDPEHASPEDLTCAFVLLLTYRFGLRSGEAIATPSNGWVEIEDIVVVLVNGVHSALKTSSSRRQVPLVGTLTDKERLVIDSWNVHWQIETRGDTSMPLFFEGASSRRVANIDAVRNRILAALRMATGDPNLTLHKARHSFANILAANCLVSQSSFPWPNMRFIGATAEKPSMDHAQVVVGGTRETRRRLWGVSRAMGHAVPRTTCGSYLHMLGDWCAHAVASKNPHQFLLQSTKGTDTAVNLDEWTVDEKYLKFEKAIQRPDHVELTPSVVIKCMRVTSRGVPLDSALKRLTIRPDDEHRLRNALRTVASRVRDVSPFDGSSSVVFARVHAFLQEVHPARWDHLLSVAANMTRSVDTNPLDPLNQVGGGSQILLFKQSHFANANAFIQAMGWSNDAVRFFKPARLNTIAEGWSNAFKFVLEKTKATNEPKQFQIAVAKEYSPGMLPATWPDRVSMVRSQKNTVVDSQAELVMLWIAYWSASSPSPAGS